MLLTIEILLPSDGPGVGDCRLRPSDSRSKKVVGEATGSLAVEVPMTARVNAAMDFFILLFFE
jgi:hypothetical protein